MPPAIPEDPIEIGWRLAPEHWGRGYATEARGRCSRFGFAISSLPEIISFAVADNYRSSAVMQRLGMPHDRDVDFHHPRVPDSPAASEAARALSADARGLARAQ